MGIALDLLGRGQEAQSAYRAVLAIAPDDRAARNNLGLSLLLSGDYEGAVAECRRLPVSPARTSNTAKSCVSAGMKGDAGSAAQIGSRDLDPASIAENQRFFTAVRRLAIPGASALQNSGNAAVTAVAY